jgi:hypothetical protein
VIYLLVYWVYQSGRTIAFNSERIRCWRKGNEAGPNRSLAGGGLAPSDTMVDVFDATVGDGFDARAEWSSRREPSQFRRSWGTPSTARTQAPRGHDARDDRQLYI